MTRKYEYDHINGRLVPPLVINSDHVLEGTHRGTVHVESGTLQLKGTLQGTLHVQEGAAVVITGTQQGTVAIAAAAAVTVFGAIQGTTTLERGATLIIEASGKLAGTLVNSGLVVLRGVFGGERVGSGQLRVEGDGYIKQPIVRDGVTYYEW